MVPPPPGRPLAYTVAPAVREFDVKVAEYLAAHDCGMLVVSAAVFRPATFTPPSAPSAPSNPSTSSALPAGSAPPPPPRVLLVKRAAHDPIPDRWEVPGGLSEPEDNVLATGARELWEESGLRAAAACAHVATVSWEEDEAEEDGGPEQRKKCDKLVFLYECEVDGGAGALPVVTLDPDEHQALTWAAEEDVQADRTAEGAAIEWTFPTEKGNVLAAFKAYREAGVTVA